MPPNRKGKSGTSTHSDKPDSTDNAADITRDWTGRPYDKPYWFYSNEKTLYDEVSGARAYIEYGIIVSDKKVSVSNVIHAQAYLNGTITKGTLRAPFDATTLPSMCTAVPQLVAPGTTPPSTPTMIIPSTLKELGPTADRFQIAPELLNEMEESIIRHWTDRILDQTLRIQTVEKFNNSGTTFIRQTHAEMNRPDSSKNAAASARHAQMRNHRAAGLADSSTRSWTDFVNKDKDYNDALVGTPKHEDEDQRAVAYDEMLQEHSKEIHTLIVVERNRLFTEALLQTPPVRLSNYDALMQAALNKFAEIETAELRKEAEAGRGLKVDPPLGGNKSPGGKKKKKKEKASKSPFVAPTEWKDPMRKCKNCEDDPIDNGEHLDKNCPRLKENSIKMIVGASARDDAGGAMEQLFDSSGEPRTLPLMAVQTPAEVLASMAVGRVAMAADDSSGDDDDDASHEEIEEQDATLSLSTPATSELRQFFVLVADDDTGGIFFGRLNAEIVPAMRVHYGQQPTHAELTSKLCGVDSRGQAIALCAVTGTTPMYHGPAAIAGAQPGDVLGEEDHSTMDDAASETISMSNSSTAASSAAPTPAPIGKLYISDSPGLEGIYYGGTETSAWTDTVLPHLRNHMRASPVFAAHGIRYTEPSADVDITITRAVKVVGDPALRAAAKPEEYLQQAAMTLFGRGAKAAVFRGPSPYFGLSPGVDLLRSLPLLDTAGASETSIALAGEPEVATPPRPASSTVVQTTPRSTPTDGPASGGVDSAGRPRSYHDMIADLERQRDRERLLELHARQQLEHELELKSRADASTRARLQLERERELKERADAALRAEDERRERRERRLDAGVKFAGFALFQTFICLLAITAHKYLNGAGEGILQAMAIVSCVLALAPLVGSMLSFTWACLVWQAKACSFLRQPGSSGGRLGRKTRYPLHHVLWDNGPPWAKVLYALLLFFSYVPTVWFYLGLSALMEQLAEAPPRLRRTVNATSRILGHGTSLGLGYLTRMLIFGVCGSPPDVMQHLSHSTLRTGHRLARGATRIRACLRFALLLFCYVFGYASTVDWSEALARRMSRGGMCFARFVRHLAIGSTYALVHAVRPDSIDPCAGMRAARAYMYVAPRGPRLRPSDAPPRCCEGPCRPEMTEFEPDELPVQDLWCPSRLAAMSPSVRKSVSRAAEIGERARALSNVLPPRRSRERSRLGRALIMGKAKATTLRTSASRANLRPSGALAWIFGIIDSGCSWHVHYRAEDLINLRPCGDRFRGIDQKVHRAAGIGDMPVVVKTSQGKHIKVLIRNVRLVPSLNDTLFSVDQFWEDSRVDTVFRDVRSVVLPGTTTNPAVRLPFTRRGKLFQWSILPIAPSAGRERDLRNELPSETVRSLRAASIHAPTSRDHVASLPPNQMMDVMHRRLHLGADILRRLGDLSADVPANIKGGKTHSCEHCKTANAAHLPHNGAAYRPSYAGRLVHADIAGPFRRSAHGQHQYFLVLIDDHTRWKEVYFLRNKGEALAKIRSFVAKFKSMADRGKGEPTRVVGTLHTDNAGEFLSRQFEELLAEETMEHTRCPAHVHQLNGVAERAIRSILELVRANLEASRAPVGFWPYLVEHAVDCLNRTTGPPGSDKSAYEMLTGEKPKLLTILPFGCRAYAVKPRAAFTKSNFASRAWLGINLGRVRHTPGAYNIWVPDDGKVVSTSEVYFDEGVMPWRPKGDQRIGESLPTPPPTALDSLDESSPACDDAVTPPPAVTTAEAFDRATRGEAAFARRSRKVLILFSGPYRRPDGLAAFLRKFGLEPVLLDNDPESGGGAAGDILNDDVHNELLRRVSDGEFLCIIAAPPCSTFSISRHYAAEGSADDGPPMVRNRSHIRGLPDVPLAHRKELKQANAIVARMAAIIAAGFAVGTQFVIENPADRGDDAYPRRFLDPEHGPLWLMPEIQALQKLTAKMATFPMCAFHAPWQKYTSLLYSSGFDEWLDPLDRLTCEHSTHERRAGGSVGPNGISSSETSAYPADFNHYLARAVLSLVTESDTRPGQAVPDVRTHGPDGGTVADPALRPSLLHDPPRTAPAPRQENIGAPEPAETDIPQAAEPEPPEEHAPETREPHGSPSPTRARTKKSPFMRSAGPHQTRAARRRLGGELAPGVGNSDGWVNALQYLEALETESFEVRGGDGFAGLAKPSSNDPKNRREAYRRDPKGWRESELKEIRNHEANGSWVLVERSSVPRGRALIKLIWVYKIKRDGSLKSRLCVQGCRQVEGVDYQQTWCGTMRGTSLRLLSAVAARTGMRMRRWDFVAAYLQGELVDGEVVYCHPPEGYERLGKDGLPMICKIVKPVYGMAQAGRRWQRTLHPWLVEYGFRQLSPDSSVFTLEREMTTSSGKRLERLHLGVYVDDLCILYGYDDEHSLYHDFTSKLQERWKVEDEGDLHDLLGVEFLFDNSTVTLHQKTYIEKLCADFLPEGVPPQYQSNRPPCDHTLPLHVAEAMSQTEWPDPVLQRRYQSLVGALLYCSGNTRPDVAFAVGMLCRAMSKPTETLLQDGLRVLSYLYRTRHLGLRYEKSESPLRGQSDSDWGVRHSTTGWQFSYAMATVSWGSKKQASVALSSCEAEIMAASEAAKESLFLSRFLNELGLGSKEPIELGMDNQAAIAISYNPELHSRTKHIDRRHFFVRECVENMQLRVPFVRTVDNLADFFTKPLAKNDFFRMRDVLMNVPRSERVPVKPVASAAAVARPPLTDSADKSVARRITFDLGEHPPPERRSRRDATRHHSTFIRKLLEAEDKWESAMAHLDYMYSSRSKPALSVRGG